MPLRIDFHVHTYYSYDSTITPSQLVAYAKKRGLNGIAITDHDRIDGALKIAKKYSGKTGLIIIPGTEVLSRNGHILALNVQKSIPTGLTVGETLEIVHKQGGIAVVAHPNALYQGTLERRMLWKFDAMEVINSSTFPFRFATYINRKIATHFGLAELAGTDAHYAPEIGYAYTIVNSESNLDEILEAIRKRETKAYGKPIPIKIRIGREIGSLKRKISGK